MRLQDICLELGYFRQNTKYNNSTRAIFSGSFSASRSRAKRGVVAWVRVGVLHYIRVRSVVRVLRTTVRYRSTTTKCFALLYFAFTPSTRSFDLHIKFFSSPKQSTVVYRYHRLTRIVYGVQS